MIDTLIAGHLYSNEEIIRFLEVSNAGGIRPVIRNGTVSRVVLMTSVGGVHGAGENPYHDRLEGATLVYTAAGKRGAQSLSGTNGRLAEQKDLNFPIHGFQLVASRRDKTVGPRRWRYLGLLEYLRHYQDTQLDAGGEVRKVWLFEFAVLPPAEVAIAGDGEISHRALTESRSLRDDGPGDDEIVREPEMLPDDPAAIERTRMRLLAMSPANFETFIRDLMAHCGFADVCVTRFTGDGGIDVNARAGRRMWALESTLVQVQAKRWLRSVGRREVAELRGSLQQFARGAVVTTSHFSRTAIAEAAEPGKNPIVLVDGSKLSRIVLECGFPLNEAETGQLRSAAGSGMEL